MAVVGAGALHAPPRVAADQRSALRRWAPRARVRAFAQVKEVREVFGRRKDRLRERHTFHLDDTVVEYFDPGSAFGLKEVRARARTPSHPPLTF